MTLTQLEYVLALNTSGSFSEAAAQCFVTQPTLSMQIQKLESELGVVIFKRDKSPIIPTDVGLKIIEQAKLIIKEKEKLNVLVQIEKGELVGSFKIAIIPTISSSLLPMFLSNFIRKYPDIELIIDEVTTTEVISGLNKGFYDVGIIALRSSIDNILSESLFYEPFVAFVPTDHKLMKKSKISQDDLSVDDFLLLKEGHCLRDQALTICKTSEKNWVEKNNKVIFESGNLETIIKLVEQKFGMTLLPFLATKYIKTRKRDKQLKEFSDPVPKREVGFIYSNTFVKMHFLSAIREEILKVIPEEFKQNKKGLVIH
jgi:LysR family hydrogen peroxide-inducible transcriptional activator